MLNLNRPIKMPFIILTFLLISCEKETSEVLDADLTLKQQIAQKILKKTKKSDNNSEIHEYLDVENELSSKIGLKTKITFNKDKKNGALTIVFKNLDQLDFIIKKLN